MDTVIEKHDLLRSARESGQKLHYGALNPICSIKHYEMPPDKHVYKGRITFRGDDVRDEDGAIAVFQELSASPTSNPRLQLRDSLRPTSGTQPYYRRCSESISPGFSPVPVSDVGANSMRALARRWFMGRKVSPTHVQTAKGTLRTSGIRRSLGKTFYGNHHQEA